MGSSDARLQHPVAFTAPRAFPPRSSAQEFAVRLLLGTLAALSLTIAACLLG